MDREKIKLQTLDDEEIVIRAKDIEMIHMNIVKLSLKVSQWLKDGKLELKEHRLTPESLIDLLDFLKDKKVNKQVSLGSSRHFLKYFPTSEILKKHEEYIESLPEYDIE